MKIRIGSFFKNLIYLLPRASLLFFCIYAHAEDISLQCGELEVKITCGQGVGPAYEKNRNYLPKCNKNVLSYTTKDGKSHQIITPKNIQGNTGIERTPDSFSCKKGMATPTHYYLLVFFADGGNTCSGCLSQILYEAKPDKLRPITRKKAEEEGALYGPFDPFFYTNKNER